MLTPEKAKEAFLASIPRRRSEFARRVDERRRTIAHETGYVARYPQEVMRFAEEEVRVRHQAAAERVKAVLDSGWIPQNPSLVRGAFTDCFGFQDFREDPFSDVYDRVVRAYEEVGQPVPAGVHPKRDLGEIQSAIAKECVSDLEMYVAKRDNPSTTFHNYAPVSVQQVGNSNVAHTTQTSEEFKAIANALRTIRELLDGLPQGDRDEVRRHLEAIEERSRRLLPETRD
jgi:hypothetical protein